MPLAHKRDAVWSALHVTPDSRLQYTCNTVPGPTGETVKGLRTRRRFLYLPTNHGWSDNCLNLNGPQFCTMHANPMRTRWKRCVIGVERRVARAYKLRADPEDISPSDIDAW
jgi:hypothetical protein